MLAQKRQESVDQSTSLQQSSKDPSDKENSVVRITLPPLPSLPKFNSARADLIRWLKQRCEYSDSPFQDPGYSVYYKSMFNTMDSHKLVYKDGDIDHELNIGYVDYGFEEEKDPEDVCLEQFIDYVPANREGLKEAISTMINGLPYDEAVDIRTKMSRENILILPGSNHSNANYLYKLITLECLKLNNKKEKPYFVPYVSPDPRVPFRSNSKGVGVHIDKEDFYSFIKAHSYDTRKFGH
ncbi:hypothetical protein YASMINEVIRUS_801 [Yasminevirus sp. GU-2018]|uniref:Uncharacterized protein n=1 Tax=Yasminevirus sp. GU-2018 TaxID=2420051 RepID=A0A5K0U8G3_9VIRU|nr:hypothetical protein YASMINEVIRUS_801 [Yasminevirus sp. GU-2018]